MDTHSEKNQWLSVPEPMYKPDLELLSKFQAFSTEILRLSLLGLSVFGVMLTANILNTVKIKWYVIISIIAFGISSGLSLTHRFYSTQGFRYHIQAIRKNNVEKRDCSNKNYQISAKFLGGAIIALTVGAATLAVGFVFAALCPNSA